MALVVAVTSEAVGNNVGLLAFVALVRSFAPTFHPVATPSAAITLNRSRIADVTLAAATSVGDGMFAAEPGYYLESNYARLAGGTPAYIAGDSEMGSQPVPYALIEHLAAEHFSFLNRAKRFDRQPEPGCSRRSHPGTARTAPPPSRSNH